MGGYMDLDMFANVADVVSIPISIVGVVLVLHQLYLTRLESEREHLRTKNEMTLNAYSTVRKDLRVITTRVRKELEINDMFDHVTEAQIDRIMSDKNLRHDVSEMLSLLNKFAVGVKHDIFNIDILNELSGKYFIKTHKQFKPYINRVRQNSKSLYSEYDHLVEKLKRMEDQHLDLVAASKIEEVDLHSTIKQLFLSSSPKMVELLTMMGIFIMLIAIIGVYLHNIHALPTVMVKIIIGSFVSIVVLIVIQLFYAIRSYFR